MVIEIIELKWQSDKMICLMHHALQYCDPEID